MSSARVDILTKKLVFLRVTYPRKKWMGKTEAEYDSPSSKLAVKRSLVMELLMTDGE